MIQVVSQLGDITGLDSKASDSAERVISGAQQRFREFYKKA